MKFSTILAAIAGATAINRGNYVHGDFDTTEYEQDYSIGKRGLIEAKKELLKDIQNSHNRKVHPFNWRVTGVHDEDQFVDDYKVAKGYDRAVGDLSPEEKEKFGSLEDF